MKLGELRITNYFPNRLFNLGIIGSYTKCHFDRENELFKGDRQIRIDIGLVFLSVVITYTLKNHKGFYRKIADMYVDSEDNVAINYTQHLKPEKMVELLKASVGKAEDKIQYGGMSAHL